MSSSVKAEKKRLSPSEKSPRVVEAGEDAVGEGVALGEENSEGSMSSGVADIIMGVAG